MTRPRTAGPARPGSDTGSDMSARPAAGGRLEVAFAGFDQSRDAKRRLVRYLLTNHAGKTIRSVRLRFHYRDDKGKAIGSFPLQVVKPGAEFAKGVTLKESFEVLGQEGPPEAVASVRIEIREIAFADGTHWRAPRRPRP